MWAYFDVHNSYETDKGMIRKWMMPSVVAFYGSKAGLIVYKSRLMIGRLGLHDGGGEVWKRGEIIYVWTCCTTVALILVCQKWIYDQQFVGSRLELMI